VRPGERCTTTDSDLSRLAAAYIHRPPDDFVLERADSVATEAGLGPGKVGLDVGGGPGWHAARWMAMGADAIVVDPSADMNRLAREAFPDLPVVRAGAERLPFRSDSATLIYFHLSIHHTPWRQALVEAQRVVAPGGRVEVITLGPDHHRASMLARWFDRIADLDIARFPAPRAIAADLERLGGVVTMSQTEQVKRRRASEWIEAVRARFISTLQFLDDDEIEEGLARMMAATPDLSADVEYSMIWDRVSARF
jgi:ubiquinone/menaquinone biosynthesis C-methylase UbiE